MKGGVLRALPPEGPLASRRKGPEHPANLSKMSPDRCLCPGYKRAGEVWGGPGPVELHPFRSGSLSTSPYLSRASTRRTCAACQVPRLVGVETPRAFNAVAMARNDVTPAARSPAIIGASSDVRGGCGQRFEGCRFSSHRRPYTRRRWRLFPVRSPCCRLAYPADGCSPRTLCGLSA
jgi:hypothetical protein